MGTINRRNLLLGSSLLPLIFVPRIGGAEEVQINQMYAGKIIYSKQPIDPKNVNPAALSTNFTSRDNIYGVAFFDKQIKDMVLTDANLLYFTAVGNDPSAGIKSGRIQSIIFDADTFQELLSRQPEWKDATVLYLDISPNPSDRKIYPLFASRSENVLASSCYYIAKGSTYKMAMTTAIESRIRPDDIKTAPQAKGPLNIVLSKDDFEYHKKQQQLYHNRYYGT